MGKARVVFEHEFDEEFLDELNVVRATRIALAERQLSRLEQTHRDMIDRGLLDETGDQVTPNEIAVELRSKIDELRKRCQSKTLTVFADELSYYIDIMERAVKDRACANAQV